MNVSEFDVRLDLKRVVLAKHEIDGGKCEMERRKVRDIKMIEEL